MANPPNLFANPSVSANVQIPPSNANVRGEGQFLNGIPLGNGNAQRQLNNANDVALSIVRNNPAFREGDEGYKTSWEFKSPANGKTYRIQLRHEGSYQALTESDWQRVEECAKKIILGLGNREGIKKASFSLQNGECHYSDHLGNAKTINTAQIDPNNQQQSTYLNTCLTELRTEVPNVLKNARIVEIANREGATSKGDAVERLRGRQNLQKSDIEHYLVYLQATYTGSTAQANVHKKAASLKYITRLTELEAAPANNNNNQPAPAPNLHEGWIKPYFDAHLNLTEAEKKQLYFAAVIGENPLITIGVDFATKEIVYFDATGCPDDNNNPRKAHYDAHFHAKLDALKTALNVSHNYDPQNQWKISRQLVKKAEANNIAVSNLHYMEESLKGFAFQSDILPQNQTWDAIRDRMAVAIDVPALPPIQNNNNPNPAPNPNRGFLGNAWDKVKGAFGRVFRRRQP